MHQELWNCRSKQKVLGIWINVAENKKSSDGKVTSGDFFANKIALRTVVFFNLPALESCEERALQRAHRKNCCLRTRYLSFKGSFVKEMSDYTQNTSFLVRKTWFQPQILGLKMWIIDHRPLWRSITHEKLVSEKDKRIEMKIVAILVKYDMINTQ